MAILHLKLVDIASRLVDSIRHHLKANITAENPVSAFPIGRQFCQGLQGFAIDTVASLKDIGS